MFDCYVARRLTVLAKVFSLCAVGCATSAAAKNRPSRSPCSHLLPGLPLLTDRQVPPHLHGRSLIA